MGSLKSSRRPGAIDTGKIMSWLPPTYLARLWLKTRPDRLSGIDGLIKQAVNQLFGAPAHKPFSQGSGLAGPKYAEIGLVVFF